MTRRVVANLLFLYQKCNQLCTLKITQNTKTGKQYMKMTNQLYIPKITQDPKTSLSNCSLVNSCIFPKLHRILKPIDIIT